jgi:hypothetical protein
MRYCFVVFVLVVGVSSAFSQTSSFSYKGKPISPEALKPFLPGMESGDTIRPQSVNLGDFKREVVVDTFKGEIFYRCYVEYGEIISYKVFQKISGDRFVVRAYSTGGTLTMPYVFIFKIVGDELVKVGWFIAEPLYKNPQTTLRIKGGVITNGSIRYKIPE